LQGFLTCITNPSYTYKLCTKPQQEESYARPSQHALKPQSKPSHFDVKKTKRFTSKLLQLAAAPKRYKQKRRRKGIKGAGKLKEKTRIKRGIPRTPRSVRQKNNRGKEKKATGKKEEANGKRRINELGDLVGAKNDWMTVGASGVCQ
jgi:hypothetical protein